MDATKLYVHSISQPLPFDDIKFERNICLEEMLNTPDDSDIGVFLKLIYFIL